MKHKTLNLAGVVLLSQCAQVVVAQDLNLFEATESVAEQAQTRVTERVQTNNTTPAFTLKSNSRFADKYIVVLVDRNGKSSEVVWTKGQNAAIESHIDFGVVDVSSTAVTVSHPSSDRCVAMPASGVECNGINMSVLSLATLTPLVSNGGSGSPTEQNAGIAGPAQAEPEPEVFVNPFSGELETVPQLSEAERKAREERQRARAERLSQFEPVRIKDEEVPPGMRVVRTPFGDRLVPERE